VLVPAARAQIEVRLHHRSQHLSSLRFEHSLDLVQRCVPSLPSLLNASSSISMPCRESQNGLCLAIVLVCAVDIASS
jgi:hypothetical protein